MAIQVLVPLPKNAKRKSAWRFLSRALLFSENDLTGFMIHGFYDGKRLKLVTQIADDLSAHLEALFNGNADTFHRAACLINNGNKTLQGTAVCQKIVNDQHMVVSRKKLFGH